MVGLWPESPAVFATQTDSSKGSSELPLRAFSPVRIWMRTEHRHLCPRAADVSGGWSAKARGAYLVVGLAPQLELLAHICRGEEHMPVGSATVSSSCAAHLKGSLRPAPKLAPMVRLHSFFRTISCSTCRPAIDRQPAARGARAPLQSLRQQAEVAKSPDLCGAPAMRYLWDAIKVVPKPSAERRSRPLPEPIDSITISSDGFCDSVQANASPAGLLAATPPTLSSQARSRRCARAAGP